MHNQFQRSYDIISVTKVDVKHKRYFMFAHNTACLMSQALWHIWQFVNNTTITRWQLPPIQFLPIERNRARKSSS